MVAAADLQLIPVDCKLCGAVRTNIATVDDVDASMRREGRIGRGRRGNNLGRGRRKEGWC